MLFKEIIQYNKQATHEEIPDEELWEDGEIDELQVRNKIANRVLQLGDWKLIRRIDG